MLPFEPQPTSDLKGRFANALLRSWSVAKVSDNQNERPGNKPENNFDFYEGIRLIISRDHHEGKEYIHVSGSIDPTYFKGARNDIQGCLDLMLKLFRQISGYTGEMKYMGLTSGKWVPHWLGEMQTLN